MIGIISSILSMITTVEESLVPLLKRNEVNVFFQSIRLSPYVAQYPGQLHRRSRHPGRQQATQTQRVALVVRKCCPFVQPRIVQQIHSPFSMKMKLHWHDQRSLSQVEMDPGFENMPWSADAKGQISS